MSSRYTAILDHSMPVLVHLERPGNKIPNVLHLLRKRHIIKTKLPAWKTPQIRKFLRPVRETPSPSAQTPRHAAQ